MTIENDEWQMLIAHYEPETDEDTHARWRDLFSADLSADRNGPLLLINHFSFRERAQYEDGRARSGQEAFAAYAEVSTPALARVGGRFLATAPSTTSLFGRPSRQYDLVVIGWYPKREALLELLRDEAYRDAFHHRRAALRVDEVTVLDALPA